MRFFHRRHFTKTALLVGVVLLSCFLVSTHPTLAQVNTAYDNVALGDTDLRDTVQIFINIFLGVLALIAVVILLYGGFTWMTSNGNEEKIERAKKILKNGGIGLVIIFASWAIVLYIFGLLAEGTGTGTDGNPSSSGGGGVPQSSSSFYVKSTLPEAGEPNASLCALQVYMSLPVDPETVNEKTHFLRVQGGGFDGEACTENNECGSGVCNASKCVGDNVAATIAFPPGDAPSYFNLVPNEDLLTETTYEATVVGGTDGVLSKDTTDDGIADTIAMSSSYVWTFTTGTEKDDVPPTVKANGNSPYPANQATDVCLNTVINFDFSEPMLASSFNGDTSFVLAQNNGTAQWDSPVALNNNSWSFGGDSLYAQVRPQEQLEPFAKYSTRLFGGDAANTYAGAVTDLCSNPLDGDADGTAEGSTVDNYFGAETAALEQPITWETGENAECTPVIENIDPLFDYYGEPGEEPGVTISGKYLGPHPEVEFKGSTIYASDSLKTCFDDKHLGNVETNTSKGTMCLNGDLQTGDQIKLNSPVGSTDSNITVIVAGEKSEQAAQTIDEQSPYIEYISPGDGAVGQYVTVGGDNYGTAVGKVLMRSADGVRESTLSLPEACGNAWTNDEIVAVVPETYTNTVDGTTGNWQTGEEAYIQVQHADGHYSDLQRFTFSDVQRPNLCEVVPQCNDVAGNSYTVTGEGFGDAQTDGREVLYTWTDDQTEYLTSVRNWSDVQIEGDNDSAMPQGEYYVSVYNGDGGYSNARKYSIPCSAGPQVVEINECSQTDGIYPAPNPAPGTSNACLNANLAVLFDQPLNTATLNSANVILQQYNSGDELNSEYPAMKVEGYFSTTSWEYKYKEENYYGFQYNITKTFADINQDGTPDSNSSVYLQPNTWYQLTITTGVQNPQGVGMDGAYTMRFRTQEGSDLCTVDTVNVAPIGATLNEYWDDQKGDRASQQYQGSAYNAECQMLDSSLMSWNWSIDNQNIGDFGSAGTTIPSGGATQNVYVAGDDEGNEGTAKVQTKVNGEDEITDDADFTVDLAFCTSDADCASCSNSYGQQSTCNLETNHCTPVIQSFSPDDGKEGTWATVKGCMFGSRKGNMYWDNGGDRTPTAWPDSNQCGDTWTGEQIIAQVPEGLPKENHYIEVETQYGDTTSLETVGGPSFSVNDATHAGLCKIDPNKAVEQQKVTAQGNTLGDEKGQASFMGSTQRIAADDDDTEWSQTSITTSVPGGAVHSADGFVAVLPGGDQQQCPADDTFCSNSVGFETYCSNNLDCATGCCASSGRCTDAAFCSVCDDDTDCSKGGQCGGSSCNSGVCTPVINEVYYNSGPVQSPVTISGCYFGTYNAEQSAVNFGESTANLFCANGWSDNQIIAEVPADIPLNTTVDIVVNTVNGTTTDDEKFTVVDQCSNGYDVPETGVPLLCDLYPGTGQYPSGDGAVEGTKVTFNGDHYVDGNQSNQFIDANEKPHAGDDLTVSSADTSSAVVPGDMKSSGSAAVEVNQCRGNALDFAIQCGSTADCADGSYCVNGYCSQNACGGCTPGTADSSCRSADGCYYNGGAGAYCCAARPEVKSTTPKNESENICPNSYFFIEFSEEMANVSALKLTYLVYENGEVKDEKDLAINTRVDQENTAKIYFEPADGWITNKDLDDGYRLTIPSDPATEGGLIAKSTGLAMQGGTQEVTFKLAPNVCAPTALDLHSIENGTDTYTFTEAEASTNFVVNMLSSDGQQLQPTPAMGWEFAWSPYENDNRCDNVAWVDLPAPSEDEPEDPAAEPTQKESSAASEIQSIVSGSEHNGETSILVKATPTAGWKEGDLDNPNDTDEASIFTYFCPEDQTWLYQDDDGDPLNQHLRLIYCTDKGLPRLDTISVNSSSDTDVDDFFRQYLFVNPQNAEQAFGIRVYDNKKNLSPKEWYKQNAPNPESATTLTVDGYEAVKDGNSYYVAASNSINGELYNNIYLFTFNDDPQVLQIADQIMTSVRFNTNISHAQCDASDKNKLIRDTKRVNDIGTIQLYAKQYYDRTGKYPRPKSESFGSYVEAFTTSVWPSWQGALGNIFGQTLGEDPYNFFLASESNQPWNADETPWLDEEGDSLDCPNEPSEGQYYDESGTCWDDVNKSFYCPENSYTYAWKVDPTRPDDSNKAYLYARMEYINQNGDEYATTPDSLVSACSGISKAECQCYNYATGVSDGGNWNELKEDEPVQ